MAKKILIISDYLPPRNSGAGQRAYNHFLMLRRDGYNVNIVTQKPLDKNIIKNNLEIESNNVFRNDIIEIDTKYLNQNNKNTLLKLIINILSMVKIFYQLNSKIKDRKINIVHGFTTSPLFYATALYLKIFNSKVKIITEITAFNPPGHIYIKKGGFINRIIYVLNKIPFHFIDKIVTLSPANDKNFTDFFGNHKKNTLITNGVDLKNFKPINTDIKNVLRNNHNFQKYELILINIGAVVAERKRIDLFEGLIKILGENYLKKKIRFIFAGNYDRTNKHREVYDKILSVGENYSNISINFLGHVSDVNTFIKLSDIGIFMSEREGLPNAVIECMACGVPVIHNRINGISDFIIEHNVDSFIANNNDLQTYADKIISLIKNKELYNTVSLNARNKIMSKFNAKNIFKKYKELYEGLFR